MGDRKRNTSRDAGLQEHEDQQYKKPAMYRVVLHNDEFTPIDWVSGLIRYVFRKSPEESARLTLQIHNKGSAILGVYTYGIAETKCALVTRMADSDGWPLLATMEPDT